MVQLQIKASCAVSGKARLGVGLPEGSEPGWEGYVIDRLNSTAQRVKTIGLG